MLPLRMLASDCASSTGAKTLRTAAVPTLIRQARAAGCDRVIQIQPRQPAGWSLETRSLQVTAVGVAYRKHAGTGAIHGRDFQKRTS